MSKKLKCLSIIMAASVITSSVSGISAMAEERVDGVKVSESVISEENDVNNDKAQDVEAESKEAVSNDGQAIVDDFQKDNEESKVDLEASALKETAEVTDKENTVEDSNIAEDEVVWGEDSDYSWDDENRIKINNVRFKLQDSGTVAIQQANDIDYHSNAFGDPYTSVSGDLVLPSKVKVGGSYYEVTAIEKEAFYLCRDLTSVVIPDGVKTIGSNAFAGCYSLKKVVLPKNLEEFNGNIFRASYNIEDISIASDSKAFTCEDNIIFNKDKSKLIFSFNTSFENYTIPKTVESIDDYAFSYNKTLQSLTIPEGVKEIGIGAFLNCPNIKNISIPSSVNSIKEYAFEACTGIQSITFAENSKLEKISRNTFGMCTNVVNVILPKSLKEIDASAFSNCTKLNNIVLPEGLKSIGASAFSRCYTLENISIPESVEEIGGAAFACCSNLKSCNLEKINLKNIGYNLFNGCESLKEVKLPETLESIESGSFSRCSSLESISIPNNVKEIEDRAFNECISLKYIKLPDSLTKLTSEMFRECSSLEYLKIPEGVKVIESRALEECSNLKRLEIPSTVEKIGKYNTTGSSDLEIIVDENNKNYAVYNGSLCTKDGSKVIIQGGEINK